MAVEPGLNPFKLKIWATARSPYEKTLFLDTDTWILKSVEPIFALLDEGYEWCIAPRPDFTLVNGALTLLAYQHATDDNTGVIAFRKSPAVSRLFDRWHSAICNQDETQILPGTYCDQLYFNAKVKGSPEYSAPRKLTLNPKEWNLRSFALRKAIAGGAIAETRILHTRPYEAGHIARLSCLAFLILVWALRSDRT